jgi:hypothetical protein
MKVLTSRNIIGTVRVGILFLSCSSKTDRGTPNSPASAKQEKEMQLAGDNNIILGHFVKIKPSISVPF